MNLRLQDLLLQLVVLSLRINSLQITLRGVLISQFDANACGRDQVLAMLRLHQFGTGSQGIINILDQITRLDVATL